MPCHSLALCCNADDDKVSCVRKVQLLWFYVLIIDISCVFIIINYYFIINITLSFDLSKSKPKRLKLISQSLWNKPLLQLVDVHEERVEGHAKHTRIIWANFGIHRCFGDHIQRIQKAFQWSKTLHRSQALQSNPLDWRRRRHHLSARKRIQSVGDIWLHLLKMMMKSKV